jgi:hypothetical protein
MLNDSWAGRNPTKGCSADGRRRNSRELSSPKVKVLQWKSVNKKETSISAEKVNSPRYNKMCKCIFGFLFSGAVDVSVRLDVTLRHWATFWSLRIRHLRSVETSGINPVTQRSWVTFWLLRLIPLRSVETSGTNSVMQHRCVTFSLLRMSPLRSPETSGTIQWRGVAEWHFDY